MAVLKGIAPIFPVRDLHASLSHYAALGFATRAYDGGGYGYVTRDGVQIHLGTADAPAGPASAYLFVDDAAALADAWHAAGAVVHMPVDTAWGRHEGALVDLDGNVIRFGSAIVAPER